ncbi:alpha/beta hydrolase [Undibacterium sp. TS12]|uniref:alpha/beta fold hydrolase n=1 Tax=Undibacterium sp. TS12 TaxID=2908202 RepID=UPI001F4C96A1|nr:alpha/beta hydrolase [Undibacterium sp. TS12]MCH8617718.1 alpha/beta hydrolase [Undibacterium sp. TS12]
MKRRLFLQITPAAIASSVATMWATPALAMQATDAAAFRAMRRFADLSIGKIAYVDRGHGDAALFLHGAPLNSFQWRGAIDRLSPYRRCIAPDFMGLGYTQVPEQQSLTADAQLTMLVSLLDHLKVGKVNIIASDSGGAVAQLFAVRHPSRVRSMLLSNCDVEPDSPPATIQPVLDMARAGTLADETAKWLTDKAMARATFGKAVFHNPAGFADETIEYYVTPLVSSPLRRQQYHAFHLALEPNPLAGMEAQLKHSNIPVRIVWGGSDTIFAQADADYLDRLFPQSRGIRRVPEGKLFFQEEFPDVIAEEARRLWGV